MSKNSTHKTETSTTTQAERGRRIAKKLGIGWAEKDDPIYNEPATVSFISRPGKSTESGKAGTEKTDQTVQPHNTREGVMREIHRRMEAGTSATDSPSDQTEE